MSTRRQFLSYATTASVASAAAPDGEWLSKTWTARWIYPAGAEPSNYGVYHYRRAFSLPTVPARFVLHLSADSRYHFYVNGVKVSSGPARGDLFHWRYETVDVAAHLKAGRNVLAAVVWNDGVHAAVAQWSHRTALLVQAADPAHDSLVNSNADWRCAPDPAYTAVPVPTYQLTGYYAIGPCERLDAGRHPWGWEQPAFDDSLWRPVTVGVNAAGRDAVDGPSRWMLVPRPIPPMEETPQRFAAIRQASGLPQKPSELRGLRIPAGTFVKLLIDQGHLTTAFPELSVSGGKDATISIAYTEALYQDMRPRRRKGNRNEVDGKTFIGFADTYLADGQSRTYRPLFWRTFRYVQLSIQTGEQPLTLNDFTSVYTGYPFVAKARFESGDPVHQRILETGWRTARLCAHESYMDCPYYEQLQYGGDTRIQNLISIYMTGDARLMRNAIEQLDSSRTPEGATYSRAPSVLAQYIPPFSLWWIGMVHDYWMYTDDSAFVRQMLPGVRAVLGFYQRYLAANGLLRPMPWWNYVDWVQSWNRGRPACEDDMMPAVIHLQLLLALQWSAELESALGSRHAAAESRESAQRLAPVIQSTFWDASRKMYTEDRAHTQLSQHANALAVLAGLIQGGEAQALLTLIEPAASMAKCSVYFRYYLDAALRKAGLGDRYLDRLGTWTYMLSEGLTTWAEQDNPYSRSDCHAWGASPNIEFFRTVLGIDTAAPGFARVQITPHLGKLAKASGTMPHPKGIISVSYVGNQAVIELPAGVEGTLTWKGRSTALHTGRNEITAA